METVAWAEMVEKREQHRVFGDFCVGVFLTYSVMVLYREKLKMIDRVKRGRTLIVFYGFLFCVPHFLFLA